MTHVPDNWIILKIDNKEEPVYYKVLAGWSGGYLDGDSWRLNSGITEVKDTGAHYEFIGSSGSSYLCHKEAETVRMNIGGALKQLLELYNSISIVDSEEAINEITKESADSL